MTARKNWEMGSEKSKSDANSCRALLRTWMWLFLEKQRGTSDSTASGGGGEAIARTSSHTPKWRDDVPDCVFDSLFEYQYKGHCSFPDSDNDMLVLLIEARDWHIMGSEELQLQCEAELSKRLTIASVIDYLILADDDITPAILRQAALEFIKKNGKAIGEQKTVTKGTWGTGLFRDVIRAATVSSKCEAEHSKRFTVASVIDILLHAHDTSDAILRQAALEFIEQNGKAIGELKMVTDGVSYSYRRLLRDVIRAATVSSTMQASPPRHCCQWHKQRDSMK